MLQEAEDAEPRQATGTFNPAEANIDDHQNDHLVQTTISQGGPASPEENQAGPKTFEIRSRDYIAPTSMTSLLRFQ